MRVADEVKERPAHAIRKICVDYVSFSEIRIMSDPIILNYMFMWYHLVPEKVPICMMCHSQLQMDNESGIASVKERMPTKLISE